MLDRLLSTIAGSEGAADATELGKQLGSRVDLDTLNAKFTKHAGVDDEMDRDEFEKFTKTINIPRPIAAKLWSLLDQDGSGMVSKQEFTQALTTMQQGRIWLRLCPTCTYSNNCAFCFECNANCQRSRTTPQSHVGSRAANSPAAGRRGPMTG